MKVIDLRSDTVTQPTKGMREAMASAIVGDDVYNEDPTVNHLQEMMAERLGMEAGLFVASGTMGNLVAILTHAGRGDEMILGNLAHTFLYEGGAAAGLGGVHPHILRNEDDGTIDLGAIEAAIRPDNVHFPISRLLCLESTHNRCGGTVLPLDYCRAATDLAHNHSMAVHLDGARLFNAAIAMEVEPATLTRGIDSVMVCLSKGLGAPVGSVLCGTRSFIDRAMRMRKLVGGGMRQAGIIAAAGIYALEHHVDRLRDDHENAQRLAAGIDAIPGLTCTSHGKPNSVATNLVYFTVDGAAAGKPTLDASLLSNRLKERGVLANPLGSANQMRMVTHLDVNVTDIEDTLAALESVLHET
jgi:threonine aldolase